MVLGVALGALVVDRVSGAPNVDLSGVRAVGAGIGVVGGFVLGNTLRILSTVLARTLS